MLASSLYLLLKPIIIYYLGLSVVDLHVHSLTVKLSKASFSTYIQPKNAPNTSGSVAGQTRLASRNFDRYWTSAGPSTATTSATIQVGSEPHFATATPSSSDSAAAFTNLSLTTPLHKDQFYEQVRALFEDSAISDEILTEMALRLGKTRLEIEGAEAPEVKILAESAVKETQEPDDVSDDGSDSSDCSSMVSLSDFLNKGLETALTISPKRAESLFFSRLLVRFAEERMETMRHDDSAAAKVLSESDLRNYVESRRMEMRRLGVTADDLAQVIHNALLDRVRKAFAVESDGDLIEQILSGKAYIVDSITQADSRVGEEYSSKDSVAAADSDKDSDSSELDRPKDEILMALSPRARAHFSSEVGDHAGSSAQLEDVAPDALSSDSDVEFGDVRSRLTSQMRSQKIYGSADAPDHISSDRAAHIRQIANLPHERRTSLIQTKPGNKLKTTSSVFERPPPAYHIKGSEKKVSSTVHMIYKDYKWAQEQVQKKLRAQREKERKERQEREDRRRAEDAAWDRRHKKEKEDSEEEEEEKQQQNSNIEEEDKEEFVQEMSYSEYRIAQRAQEYMETERMNAEIDKAIQAEEERKAEEERIARKKEEERRRREASAERRRLAEEEAERIRIEKAEPVRREQGGAWLIEAIWDWPPRSH